MLFKKIITWLSVAMLAVLPTAALGQDKPGLSMSFSLRDIPFSFENLEHMEYLDLDADDALLTIMKGFFPNAGMLNLNFDIDTPLADEERSLLTASTDITGLFAADLNVSLLSESIEDMQDYLTMDPYEQLQAILASTKIADLRFEYVDDGFLAMIMTVANRETEEPVPVLLQEMISGLEDELSAMPPNQLFADLLQMIKDQTARPGRILLEFTPPEPMYFTEVFLTLMSPEVTGLTMTWEQGETDLLDMIPAGLLIGAEDDNSSMPTLPDPDEGLDQPAEGRKHTRNAF